jgi:AraC-like DNA-binding protein
VAVWVLRGRVVLAVGGRELEVGPREAVVLPAGVPNSIRIPAGSLVLPLGFRSGRVGEVGAPIAPARTAADEEDDLIQAMVAAYTDLRPRGFDPSSGFALVQARSTRCETTADDAAVSALASGLATGAVGDPSLAGCARWLGIPGRELSRIINDRAGMTFAQWIRVSRMSRARARLHGGEPASAVSRVLGYAHLPAFSRAFREVHGLSPQGVAASQAQAGEAGRWHRELSDRITRAHAPAPAQPRRAVLGPLSDRTRSSSSSRDR